jgi:hypothetical protein
VVLPASHRISRVRWYSGCQSLLKPFHLQDFYLLWSTFPGSSVKVSFDYTGPQPHISFPIWFGLFPFRSPLLRESIIALLAERFFFLFLRVLRCFSSPGLPPIHYFVHVWVTFRLGFPIRTSPDLRLFAPPRSFSQLIASFIGSWCQGILRAPLLT